MERSMWRRCRHGRLGSFRTALGALCRARLDCTIKGQRAMGGRHVSSHSAQNPLQKYYVEDERGDRE